MESAALLPPLPLLPASANTAAIIGDDWLVPPTSFQPPLPLEVSYTAAPVAGSASAATSLSTLCEQAAARLETAFCQDGWGSLDEQPDPGPPLLLVYQTFSVQPRAFEAVLSDVPPTPTTLGEVAG